MSRSEYVMEGGLDSLRVALFEQARRCESIEIRRMELEDGFCQRTRHKF